MIFSTILAFMASLQAGPTVTSTLCVDLSGPDVIAEDAFVSGTVDTTIVPGIPSALLHATSAKPSVSGVFGFEEDAEWAGTTPGPVDADGAVPCTLKVKVWTSLYGTGTAAVSQVGGALLANTVSSVDSWTDRGYTLVSTKAIKDSDTGKWIVHDLVSLSISATGTATAKAKLTDATLIFPTTP